MLNRLIVRLYTLLQESLPPVWLQLLSRCVRSNQRCPTTHMSCGQRALQQLMAQQKVTERPALYVYVRGFRAADCDLPKGWHVDALRP
jgi:hypothetical protein